MPREELQDMGVTLSRSNAGTLRADLLAKQAKLEEALLAVREALMVLDANPDIDKIFTALSVAMRF